MQTLMTDASATDTVAPRAGVDFHQTFTGKPASARAALAMGQPGSPGR